MNLGNFDQPQLRRMVLPDSDQRLHRVDGEEMSHRPRRSPAALILGAIALVLIVVFIVLAATHEAEPEDDFGGASARADTAHVDGAVGMLG